MADMDAVARLALLEAEVAELRQAVAGGHDAPRPRRSGAWRQRAAVLAGVAMAGALVMGVAVASTPGNPADVTFIALSVPHKILSNASIAKAATNAVVVNGGSTTVPTDATSVQMTVAVKSAAAGSLAVFPTDNAASTTADTISFAAGNVLTTQVTKQSPGLSGKVSFKNNGTATATVTVTITGYSTQTTASNISGSGGSAGQVLTNNGAGGASWQGVPSDITWARNNFCCGGGSPYTGVAFLTGGQTLTFAGPQTAVLVTGTADLASTNGGTAQGSLGVCFQQLPGGSINYAASVFPQFAAAPGAFFAQSVTGVISGLSAGQYTVGLCAGPLTSNMAVGQRFDSAVRFTVNTSAPQAPIRAVSPRQTNQVH
jgi:hypothetical protein